MNKIFITIPWFTPAYRAGGPIRSLETMMERMGEDVQWYVFTTNKDVGQVLLDVSINKWITQNDNIHIWYSNDQNRSQVLLSQLERIKPDIIYAVGLFSWHFTIVPLWFGKAKRKVLAVKGMLHPEAIQQKALKKNLYIRFFKQIGLHRKLIFQASTETEKGYIKSVMGEKANVILAENFARQLQPLPNNQQRLSPMRLVTCALISPMKNYLKVLEALHQINAPIIYHIYGGIKDMAYWQQCLKLMDKLPPHIEVEYKGSIAADKVPETLLNYDLYIQPSESENFGHSILEALQAGLPVITSTTVPWTNLEQYGAGRNVHANVDSIKHAIESMIAINSNEWPTLRANAQKYAKAHTNNDKILQQHRQLFSMLNSES